jgi:hypothetical protein
MTLRRSLGFAVAGIAAAGATTVICFGDALGLVRSPAKADDAIVSARFGTPARPIEVLQGARP